MEALFKRHPKGRLVFSGLLALLVAAVGFSIFGLGPVLAVVAGAVVGGLSAYVASRENARFRTLFRVVTALLLATFLYGAFVFWWNYG